MRKERQTVKVADLELNLGQVEWLPRNPRQWTKADIDKTTASIREDEDFLEDRPLLCLMHGGKYIVFGGNLRTEASRKCGLMSVPAVVYTPESHEDRETVKRRAIKDNGSFGEWDFDALANEWDSKDLDDWGVDVWQEESDAPNNEEYSVEASSEAKYEPLTKDFFVFPQSVLDTRRGEWQARKRKWIEMGIASEEGRKGELTFAPTSLTPAGSTRVTRYAKEYGITKTEAARILLEKGEVSLYTTSIFDPVLCEVCYRWFNVDGGKILDPFAGGSVRGIVAGALGMPYFGNDLREEQVWANRQNLSDVSRREDFGNANPIWTVGDSLNIVDIMRDAGQKEFDMIFSCPPYADLEVYSDKKEDLSNMEYGEFVKQYREIISKSCSMLKDNRFACFVIGDVRDKKGWSRNLVNDTILAFELAGLHYYNQLILVNQVGSAAIRARGAYKTRKIVKTHQNVVVAYKGDNCKDISRDFPIQSGIQSLIDNAHEDDAVEI